VIQGYRIRKNKIMIQNIIVKVRKGISLADDEMEFLEHVISRPTHKDYSALWIAGLV
jgi:hypothetical protein